MCLNPNYPLQLGTAVMVEDTSLCFNALKGLPGEVREVAVQKIGEGWRGLARCFVPSSTTASLRCEPWAHHKLLNTQQFVLLSETYNSVPKIAGCKSARSPAEEHHWVGCSWDATTASCLPCPAVHVFAYTSHTHVCLCCRPLHQMVPGETGS